MACDDAWRVCHPDFKQPFSSLEDACQRLSRVAQADHQESPQDQRLVRPVTSNGIHVDPSKIEAVKNWKVPKTPSGIRSFLGLAAIKESSCKRRSKLAFENADFEFESRVDTFRDKEIYLVI
ncbi:putative reverse transcriptase domain-containing protein [Tanacetum coccineum]|uniref:Reverse transcriptase domain-containing protein n=1 Tax=Tanacetum coccineum TaxID=301880 RepID=A0ABQ5EMJ4_9ASTR